MGKKKPDCKKCVFRAVNRPWLCNYETVTGHTRLAEPPKKCTHFKEGEPARQNGFELLEKLRRAENQENRRRTGRKEKYDWTIAKRLYEQGKSDGEIAEVMGCYASVVRVWRKRNDLQINIKPRKKRVVKSRFDWDKGRTLYDRGMSDGEIAKVLGCNKNSVLKWRGRTNLPANKERNQKKGDTKK